MRLESADAGDRAADAMSAFPTPPPRRVHAFVTVWGSHHVSKWADFSLRTQLSAGNLPALASAGVEIDYHVFTDRESASLLDQRTAALREYARVHVRFFDEVSYAGSTLAARTAGFTDEQAKHRRNIDTAAWIIDHALEQGGAPAVANIDNDFLLADGALRDAFALLSGGAGSVMVPVLRLAVERTGWTADTFPCGRPGEPGVPGAAFRALLPDALHPLTRGLDAASEAFAQYPTSILWQVGEEGWLCRSFMPHPLMFIPVTGRWLPESTVDYSLAVSLHRGEHDNRMPAADDDILVFKHTPLGTYAVEAPRIRRLTDRRMAQFLFFHTNRAHGLFARQAVRLRKREGNDGEAQWSRVEAESLAALERWYALAAQVGADLEAGPAKDAWRSSHHGTIDDFLCPHRMAMAAHRDPSIAAFLARIGIGFA